MQKMLRCVIVILLFFSGPIAAAGTLYTWTDKDGVVHITPTKPPNGIDHTDKLTYTAKPERKTTQVHKQGADRQRELILEIEASQKARRLRREADQARKAMEAAVEAANKMKADTDAYIRQWGGWAKYRKSVKAKIDRRKDATNQAVAESERLIKTATEAEAKAREAEEALKDLNRPAMEK
ncbi:MAG: DUF4124 domain-containing protein [Deltaproteobacteria bacterium]|jgi:hypothetical protein|nr:DUF4124 domain-containing protein [Deltaproteobacteria bacterium]